MSIYFRQIQHLLPRTKTWSLPFGSTVRKFFEGLADGLSEPARDFIDGVWAEIFPETTNELVEWEQELGCWGGGTDAQRRLSLAAEWQATGGQSPRYLQDIIQAAGFDVYYHGWWDPVGEEVRDPHDYTESANSGTAQCHGTIDSIQDQCADVDTDDPPRCDFFLANEIFYIVNESLNRMAPPPLPDDEDLYRNFIYFCGETFGTYALIPAERLTELKRLVLKISPANMWIVLLAQSTIVSFTAPDPDTVFYSGVPQSVSIEANEDDDYELSFTSDFAAIRGTITVSGGTGSGNITALDADAEETALYVRKVGSAVTLNSLACTVYGVMTTTGVDNTIEITTTSATEIVIHWGDGTTTAKTDAMQVSPHTYSDGLPSHDIWIENSAALTLLYCHSCDLTGVLNVSGMASLTDLRAYANALTSVVGLSTLTSMTNLRLHNNSLTDIEDLSALISLTYLRFEDNGLSEALVDQCLNDLASTIGSRPTASYYFHGTNSAPSPGDGCDDFDAIVAHGDTIVVTGSCA